MRFRSGCETRARRFVPRLERLDERALPSVSVVEADGVLNIRGDQFANDIVITDNGTTTAGAITVQIDGQTFSSEGAITTIKVRSGSGGDSVEYDLTADLAGARTLVANLGNGDDTFLASLRTNINDTSSLTIRACGGNGKDNLSLDAVGANVGAGGSLAVTFNGGNGIDVLNLDFSGVLMGTASFTAKGGNGKDEVTGNLTIEPTTLTETGEPAPSTGSLTVDFWGGNGKDAMTLDVTGADSLTTLDVAVHGGNGKDTFDVSNADWIADPH